MGGIWASNWDDSKRIRVKAIRTNRGNGLRTAMGDKYLYGKTQGPVKYYHSGFPEENDIIAIYNVTYPQKDKEVETLIGAITLASHNVPHVQDYNNGTLKLVPIDGPRH
ncbi:hypothetical protein SOPP22_05470 [Shewanella sp. OPT22]|nr:hypothetical protein SOPP22_05470 [Shewanella sp. OPT22]